MKKLIAALLALILVSNLALIYFAVENNRLMKQMLENGAPDSGNVSEEIPVKQNSTGNVTELVHVSEDKYLTETNDWIFDFAMKNTTEKPLFIKYLNIIDNGAEDFICDENNHTNIIEDILGPEFRTTPVAPGDILYWRDGHPGEYLNTRTYLFVFTDSEGNEYTFTYDYNLIMEVGGSAVPGVDYSSDSGKDLATIFYDASFSEEVFDGVFWVPARTLGESRYTNGEISNMVSEAPETKQQKISTLYEALQLYQIGGFCAADDNIRISENGIDWEHHKPGYYAVLTNCGCCATDSNWLNYILKDDYDEVGFIATSQRDGSGHIYNYIKDGEWYYFIDLTHYRTDWVATAPESGNLDEYYRSDFILGNIHRTKSVEKFVSYVQNTFGDPPGLMFKYTAENCLAVDGLKNQSGVTIVYEKNPDVSVEIIFDDPNDSLDFRFEEPPKKRPNWG